MPSPKIKLVLQARLSSSRLPAKMLLPLAGIPLVVLCAKRAMINDHDLIVATSNQPSDDLLASTLKEHNIPYIRGDLNNVLSRFITAAEDLDDHDLVIRLTGDNPFVDAGFIDDIIAFHQSHNQDYTRTLSPQDGFPYGLSAEIITAGALRSIAAAESTDFHKEHVTIVLTESGDYALYKNPEKSDLSHLRVTVDTANDYLQAAHIFKHAKSWDAPWKDLLTILQSMPSTPKTKIPHKENGCETHSHMALGTAQLGLPYGIANTEGQPDEDNAKIILSKAIKHGITLIDTAAAYGQSETIVGQNLSNVAKQEATITTKLAPLTDIDKSTPEAEIIAHIENSVYKSLHRLGLKTLPILMLHRWEHYHFKNGLIIKTLTRLQKEGLITKLGASIQTPKEGLEALNAPDITFIQMPFNILDKRWQTNCFIAEIQNHPDTHIQARSVLLQGLLTLPAEKWPQQHSKLAENITATLNTLTEQYKRQSLADLCMAYARSQKWIDSIVIGVETPEQLHNNITLFNESFLSQEQLKTIEESLPDAPENLLNPALWETLK